MHLLKKIRLSVMKLSALKAKINPSRLEGRRLDMGLSVSTQINVDEMAYCEKFMLDLKALIDAVTEDIVSLTIVNIRRKVNERSIQKTS